MKSQSEVAKIVGIGRSTLQRYDKKKLLEKTCTNELGDCMYDNEAILKLFIIIIFSVAGYKHREIKKLLEDPTFDFGKELDKAIEYVKAKFNGIIKWFEMIRRCEKLPRSTFKAITNEDLQKVFELKCIWDYVKDFHETTKVSSNEELDVGVLLRYTIFAMGGLFDKTENSEEVQILVEECFIKMLELEGKSDDKEEKKNRASILLRDVKKLVKDKKELNRLELIFGQGIDQFIVKSFELFVRKRMGNNNLQGEI